MCFNLIIIIIDATPPLVQACPSDITITSGKWSEIITWNEPKFTDNVAIRNVMKIGRNPGKIWYPGEEILMQYVATDIAGNQKKCSFKVALKGRFVF